MANLELDGKVALITGSGRGIGKAIAFKLADMGSKIAINDLPGTTEASEVVKEIQHRSGIAMLVPGNVTVNNEVKSITETVVKTWGKIDILVNNAGVTRDALLMRMSEEDWDTVIDINLRGAFLCTKHVLRSMLGLNWGRIINMASVAGLVGSMGRVNYSASKGGLVAFTRSLASEVGPRNITVNAIAPGFIMTRLTDNLPQEAKDMVLSRTTIKRYGITQDVAELAAFLASNRAGYITGQVIGIDGGIT